MERISFHDEIAANKRKSFFLMTIVFLVIVLFGYVISMAFSEGYFFVIMSFSIVFSMGYLIFSYYNSDKIAVFSAHARPVSRSESPQLYHVVEGLTIASGLPMPKIYLMPGEQINAFASGRDPQHAVVCVTAGALEKLNKQELEGVIGHELSHIANYDIRFMTLTAVMVGMVSIIAEMFLRSLWFRSGDGDRKGSPVFLIIGIALAILAPIAVQLVQLAISRKREFAADASAVKFTRSPTGLINALGKIKDDKPMKVTKALSPLFLSDPFKRKVSGLFSTHPLVEDRIKILKKM